jgi:uncharacterized metal-binding protein YceD (DUF177 family)
MKYFLIVSKIPEGKSELSWVLDESLFEAIGANYDIEQLRGVLLVHLQKDAQYLRLEVLVEGEATVLCDRCLKPISLPFSAKHQQVYALTSRYTKPEEVEEFYILGPREDRIDLTQAAYDYVCLALPLKRVRPTCPDEYCPPYIQELLHLDPPES